MTHTHEWEAGEYLGSRGSRLRGPIARCKCGAWMEGKDMLRRLNEYETLRAELADKDLIIKQRGREIKRLFKYKEATERLSAEDARESARKLRERINLNLSIKQDAYANILEGK